MHKKSHEMVKITVHDKKQLFRANYIDSFSSGILMFAVKEFVSGFIS